MSLIKFCNCCELLDMANVNYSCYFLAHAIDRDDDILLSYYPLAMNSIRDSIKNAIEALNYVFANYAFVEICELDMFLDTTDKTSFENECWNYIDSRSRPVVKSINEGFNWITKDENSKQLDGGFIEVRRCWKLPMLRTTNF